MAEPSSKRPPRPEATGSSSGRNDNRNGNNNKGTTTAAAASASSSLGFVLPKDLLESCVGRSVAVSLTNGHELVGVLERCDEDCNILLSAARHYVVEPAAAAESAADGAFGSSSEGFAFKSTGGAAPSSVAAASGEGSRALERTRLLRQCQRVFLAGANILGIAPSAEV